MVVEYINLWETWRRWPAPRSVSLLIPKPLTSSTIRIEDSDVHLNHGFKLYEIVEAYQRLRLAALALSTP